MEGFRSRLGVNAHLPADWLIDKVADLGVQWMRCDFNWDHIQAHGPDRWDWELTDAIVHRARERGVSIYATLSHTPAWANAESGRGRPATSIMDWERFVREVSRRYDGKIQVWGVWNEFQGSVSEYITMMLRPAHAVLKTVNANNLVGAPDLATERDWPAWLRTFLQQAGNLVDVLTIHAYADDGRQVWDALTQRRNWFEQTILRRKPSIKQVIDAAGWQGQVWLTETGWRSDRVGEEGQAQRWDQLLERLMGSGWPAGVCAFQLIDEHPPDTPAERWGLFRMDGTSKPSAEVMRRYAARGVV